MVLRTSTMSRSDRFFAGAFVLQLVIAFLATASLVRANSATFNPPVAFDFDNDHFAEIVNDSVVPFDKLGNGWTSTAITRTQQALAAWSTSTDFNPFLSSSPQVQDIRIDGVAPNNSPYDHCPTDQDTWAEIGDGNPKKAYAVNCGYGTYYPPGTPGAGLYGFYRLTDADIFLNSTNWTFDWGTSASTNPSARGVLTHEMGHSAMLIDLPAAQCGSPKITMCESASVADTWVLYTLENDDLSSANQMYN